MRSIQHDAEHKDLVLGAHCALGNSQTARNTSFPRFESQMCHLSCFSSVKFKVDSKARFCSSALNFVTLMVFVYIFYCQSENRNEHPRPIC